MNRCMARLVIRIIEKCDSDWRCNDWLGLISGWMVFLDCLIGFQLNALDWLSAHGGDWLSVTILFSDCRKCGYDRFNIFFGGGAASGAV